MFLPWNRGIKTLVEQSSATTQTSTVATFVRRFFGAPGSAPQIINNFKAGDQNQPKQPWKDFRHLSKRSREEMRRDCEDLALIERHNFVIWQKTSKSRQLSPFFFETWERHVGQSSRTDTDFLLKLLLWAVPHVFMHVSRNTTTKSSTGSGKSGFMTGRRRDVWGKRRVKSPHRVLPIKSSWKHLTTRWAWRVGGCGYVNFLNGGFFQVSTCAELGDLKKKKSLTTVYIQSWLHADVDLIRLHFYTTCCQNIPQLLFVCFFFFFVLSEMRGFT